MNPTLSVLFDSFDEDFSGTMDFQEFRCVVGMLLCGACGVCPSHTNAAQSPSPPVVDDVCAVGQDGVQPGVSLVPRHVCTIATHAARWTHECTACAYERLCRVQTHPPLRPTNEQYGPEQADAGHG